MSTTTLPAPTFTLAPVGSPRAAALRGGMDEAANPPFGLD